MSEINIRCVGGPLHERAIRADPNRPAPYLQAPEPFDWLDPDPSPFAPLHDYVLRRWACVVEHPCVRGARLGLVWWVYLTGEPDNDTIRGVVTAEPAHDERRQVAASFDALNCPTWWAW